MRIVPNESIWTGARVIAGRVGAESVGAAVLRIPALVHIRAEYLAVALVAVLALAEEVRRQVTALGVLHASGCYRGILAFVNVCGRGERGGGGLINRTCHATNDK